MSPESPSHTAAEAPAAGDPRPVNPRNTPPPEELGGPSGPEPTRFGDWERKGRCVDF